MRIPDPNLDIKTDGTMLHNVDGWFEVTNYDYKGFVPEVDGQLLNHMFPKGYKMPEPPNGFNKDEGTMRYYLGWLEWQRIIEIISEQGEYKNLPEYLDKYIIEKELLENGEAAWFYDKATKRYYILPFSASEYDVYNRPSKVKLKIDNVKRFLDMEELTDFVQGKDTIDGVQIFSKVIQAITARNDCITQLKRNLNAAAPKGIFVDTYSTDDKKNMALYEMLQKMTNSPQNFYVGKMSTEDLDKFTAAARANETGQLYFDIALRDRTAELIDQIVFWTQGLQQGIGLEIDYNMDKGERKIVNEVSTQQGLSRGINLHRFNQRKLAIERVNKKYGLHIEIEGATINQAVFEEPEMNEEGPINGESNPANIPEA